MKPDLGMKQRQSTRQSTMMNLGLQATAEEVTPSGSDGDVSKQSRQRKMSGNVRKTKSGGGSKSVKKVKSSVKNTIDSINTDLQEHELSQVAFYQPMQL